MRPAFFSNLLTVFIFGFCTHSPLFADAPGGTGLSTFLSVDMVGELNAGKSSNGARDAFEIREVELSFFSPVDHLFEGMVNLAAHREDGQYVLELHEAFASTSKLIPYSKIKVGQYFLGIGRLNRFHRHDWPFISAPQFFVNFFDDEGLSDTGLEYSFLAPLPIFMELTAGVTNGWVYGHTHSEGAKPKAPMHYARLGSFFDLNDTLGMAAGLNYLNRRDDSGLDMQLIGIDFVAKNNAGSYSNMLVQLELWHSQLKPEVGAKTRALGGYLFPQMGFSKTVFFGCRLDYYSVLTLEDALGDEISNADYAIVPTLTYKSSEFASFKLAYNYKVYTQDSLNDRYERSFEIQANYLLGAHPAHEF